VSAGAFYLFRTPESVDKLGPGLLSFLRHTVSERGPQFVKHGDYRESRSLSQNDCFRGLCRDAAEAWNAAHDDKTSADALARDLKVEFGVILTEWSPVSGKRSARLKSTADYTKAEMASLITATLAWAADNGIPLPAPREARGA
jgi:hypothetical protein